MITMHKKILGITKKYEVYPTSITRNIQGTWDIELDKNIYCIEQEKMENEIRELGNINDIYYEEDELTDMFGEGGKEEIKEFYSSKLTNQEKLRDCIQDIIEYLKEAIYIRADALELESTKYELRKILEYYFKKGEK